MNPRVQRISFAAIAVTLVLGVLYWMSTSSMGEDLVYYWSPTELLEKGKQAEGATVRLMGMVEQGSVDWQPEAQKLAFRITDGTQTVAIEGQGAPPQMFREGIGVVVEGKLHADGVFRSNEVLVKHNNEYKPPEDGERPEDIYKSLINEQGGT